MQQLFFDGVLKWDFFFFFCHFGTIWWLQDLSAPWNITIRKVQDGTQPAHRQKQLNQWVVAPRESVSTEIVDDLWTSPAVPQCSFVPFNPQYPAWQFFLFLYFGCTGSSLWCSGFSLQWLLLWRNTGSGARELQESRHMGLVALQHVESSRRRDWAHVPCIGRQILNQWATREVPRLTVFMCASYFPSRKQYNVLRETQVLVRKFCFEDSIKPWVPH